METYYFGCIGRPGHFLHDQHLSIVGREVGPPWMVDRGQVDGMLAPHRKGCDKRAYCGCGSSPEGRALIHHRDGWTAMAFWDRSVDKRGGCNSAFFAEGIHNFDGMMSIAREYYPSIMARFTFEIVEEEA